jgi:hypothetical protein
MSASSIPEIPSFAEACWLLIVSPKRTPLWVEAYRTGSGSDRVGAATCAPLMHQTRSIPLPVLYSSSRR